ncbi:MAG TPA: hypothetical protein VNG69_04760 [Casimicrobiaceae bacterium]|nr:hypothetical protein [Casimicrobiaceae bacterium]
MRTLENGTLAVVAWIVSFGILVVCVAIGVVGTTGRDDVPPLLRNGRQLVPNNANARIDGNAIVVANKRDTPLTILAISQQPVHAADYGRVMVDADALPDGVELALLWVQRGQAGRVQDQRIEVDAFNRPQPTLIDRSGGWSGELALIALGVKGAMDGTKWSLRSVTLERASMGAAIGDFLRGWRRFERWDGKSINVLFGGREEQRAWLPPLAFAAAVLTVLALLFLARKRGVKLPPQVFVIPFLIGWLVLDLRWQTNLVRQARATVNDFGGRDWTQRHEAMEDGDLFGFVQRAIAKLPTEPVRIFVGSDHEYFRRRAGYHLYPHNVLAYSWGEPFQLKPGEYLLLYQKSDVHLDPSQGELLWNNGRRLDVVPLLAQRGAGLYRVGPKGGR